MFELKRNFLKQITVLVPLASENLVSSLSPTLGQYGINVNTFLEKLEEDTWFLSSDVTLRVRVSLYSNNTYTYNISVLNYNALFYSTDSEQLNFFSIYKILFLYSFVTANFNPTSLKINYKNFTGYLNSFNNDRLS
jgi:hypothetical protein